MARIFQNIQMVTTEPQVKLKYLFNSLPLELWSIRELISKMYMHKNCEPLSDIEKKSLQHW